MKEFRDLDQEMVKLRRESQGDRSQVTRAGFRSINGRRRILASNAVCLTKHLPDLVSDVEHTEIASALLISGDRLAAEEHYKLAVKYSTSTVFHAYTLRTYAIFLFETSRYDSGRELFDRAAKLQQDELKKIGDKGSLLYALGETYERWASVEAYAGFHAEAEQALKLAKTTYEAVAYPRWRGDALDNLKDLEVSVGIALTSTPGSSPGFSGSSATVSNQTSQLTN